MHATIHNVCKLDHQISSPNAKAMQIATRSARFEVKNKNFCNTHACSLEFIQLWVFFLCFLIRKGNRLVKNFVCECFNLFVDFSVIFIFCHDFLCKIFSFKKFKNFIPLNKPPPPPLKSQNKMLTKNHNQKLLL